MSYIVKRENPAPFQHIEGFVHLKVSVDRNACADPYLLGSDGEIVGTCGRSNFYEDVATITKMKQMFAFTGAGHISLPRSRLSSSDNLRKNLADAEGTQAEEKGSAFLLNCVHTSPRTMIYRADLAEFTQEDITQKEFISLATMLLCS